MKIDPWQIINDLAKTVLGRNSIREIDSEWGEAGEDGGHHIIGVHIFLASDKAENARTGLDFGNIKDGVCLVIRLSNGTILTKHMANDPDAKVE